MTYSPNGFSKFSGSSKALGSNFQNGSGSTLDKCVLVSVNASSQLVPTVVDNEALVQAIVGVTSISIPNAASGGIVDNGRLEDITTSFAVGDAIYLGKTGLLINTKPVIGSYGFVDGDFVIFVGVIVKNEFNVSLKDMKLMISVIGQL